MRPKLVYLLPLVVVGAITAFLLDGLRLDPRRVPSPLIEKPAPHFALPSLADPARQVGSRDLAGKVALLNVWASWCVACREEHPVLLALSREAVVPIYGLNYKDQRADALGWLERFGNPYRENAMDRDGRVGINYGVYGVPETFVVDKRGIIRYKQIGPVTERALRDKILPLVRKLESES